MTWNPDPVKSDRFGFQVVWSFGPGLGPMALSQAFLPPFFKGGQGGIFRQCLEIIRPLSRKALPIPKESFFN
jgi:hypothetical protein